MTVDMARFSTLDARLVGAGDGVEAAVKDHAHAVDVDRDLADRLPDLSDGEHPSDPALRG